MFLSFSTRLPLCHDCDSSFRIYEYFPQQTTQVMDSLQHFEAPFAVVFPLPFRVILLGGLGVLCWATNLHGLQLLGIDTTAALEIRAYDHEYNVPRLTSYPQNAGALVRSVYRLFYAYALWSLLGWAVFRFLTHDDPALVDEYKFVPAVFGLMLVMFLICPFNVFERHERDRFLLYVHRLLKFILESLYSLSSAL